MTQKTAEIPVEKVRANPYQPRLHFPDASQRELQESIRRNGLIQPITVREVDGGYELLAGERRFRAISDLGLPTIPAHVRNLSDEEMRTLSIIENVQREELNPIDLAKGYRSLAKDLGFSQEKIAAQIGKNRSTIANTLRLLDLPEQVQKLVSDFKLSPGHARALLPLKDSSRLKGLVSQILEKDWSVRETEKKVKTFLDEKSGPALPAKRGSKDPNVKALEEQLASHLQTRVEIWGDVEGSIQIHFSDVRDFNRVFNLILEEEKDDEFDGEEDFPDDKDI